MKESSLSSRFTFAALLATLAIVLVALAASLTAAQEGTATTPLGADEASAIATDAYIYGYPLVTVEMTRRVATNAAAPVGLHGPMGQFASARGYPTAAFRDVTAPKEALHKCFGSCINS
jgi:hypothetical protein